MSKAARVCPGLTASQRGLFWKNSLGQEIDLSREPLLVPKDVATKMGKSTEWVRRKIRDGEIYPVIIHSDLFIEVYECAIQDYRTRSTLGGLNAAA
jgi:hypothetical protein